MYKSNVIAGRIIEIRNDRVLTQQGDTICTYHFRYYMLPDEETWTDTEGISRDAFETPPQEPVPSAQHRFPGLGRRWHRGWPRFLHMRKSAHRI
ncbi:hypothetical protein J2Z22_003895 [Paenibacillus forsythiae]|uniref:Uncharacterized protein n=1 Tax=Paenibacillus forsythiae TaxID=365616 RepID=A0ABU3HBW0_9BACL|nr:hypothetical protein [Paenibacillus forsythiae]MDT3428303.1 hypothetical protein [Paenibacillus forsythiae]